MEILTTQEKVDEGLEELKENGGEVIMTGDASGEVSIQGVDAKFNYIGGILNIIITDKPWVVSEEYVEDKIRKYFD